MNIIAACGIIMYNRMISDGEEMDGVHEGATGDAQETDDIEAEEDTIENTYTRDQIRQQFI